MAMLCKNCGRPVKFDPSIKSLTCSYCGSGFAPDELEEYGKEILEDVEPQPVDPDRLMDCYVYACSSCGGEVIVNGREASTSCIYCGSPSVVFSRIAKYKRPDLIIPFRVSREETVALIREKFKEGIAIPKEIKRLKAEDVRGIYIPYWIADAEHRGAVTFVVSETGAPCYCTKTGYMPIKGLPVEASHMLSNDVSSKLEPYNIRALKPFEESYLLGFYSDAADIDFPELDRAVEYKAQNCFMEYAKEMGTGSTIKSSKHITEVDHSSLRYAMFPVWFVTYRYKGHLNAILINGESGKFACGVPWDKKQIITLYILAGLLCTALLYLCAGRPLLSFFDGVQFSFTTLIALLMTVIVVPLMLFGYAYDRMKKIKDMLGIAQEETLFRFVKRRQG